MIINPRIVRFTPINRAEFTVPAGVEMWVDTDLSATCGTDISKLWVGYLASTVAGSKVGIRSPVDVGAPIADAWNFIPAFFHVSHTGHAEIYRVPGANNSVEILGYMSGVY